MNQRIRDIVTALEQRREANEFPCDSCCSTGLYVGKVCSDCLGQKVLLSLREYEEILELAEGSVLDAEILT